MAIKYSFDIENECNNNNSKTELHNSITKYNEKNYNSFSIVLKKKI